MIKFYLFDKILGRIVFGNWAFNPHGRQKIIRITYLSCN